MSPETEYDNIVGALYEAAVRPEAWTQALVALSSWSGADCFHLMKWNTVSQQPEFNIHGDGYEAAIHLYGEYYAGVDPRRALVSAGPVGDISACQDRFDASFISRSEFYQDFLGRFGMRHTLSSLVHDAGGRQVLLGLVRASERGAYTDEQIARVERIMPHFVRASGLWQQTQDLQAMLAIEHQVSMASGYAVFGLDAAASLVHANAQAEALLRDGDSLVVKGGKLSATHPNDAGRLQRAFEEATRSGTADSFAIDGLRGGPQSCFVNVASLPSGAALVPLLGRACVLVMARQRQQRSALSAQQLNRMFGLTPAECAAALALADGKAPEAYAQEAKLSLATVRTQLRAVFAKTNTSGQVEAVRLLQNLPR
jgi:DNA-binding CsgD family transcriptional regulator